MVWCYITWQKRGLVPEMKFSFKCFCIYAEENVSCLEAHWRNGSGSAPDNLSCHSGLHDGIRSHHVSGKPLSLGHPQLSAISQVSDIRRKGFMFWEILSGLRRKCLFQEIWHYPYVSCTEFNEVSSWGLWIKQAHQQVHSDFLHHILCLVSIKTSPLTKSPWICAHRFFCDPCCSLSSSPSTSECLTWLTLSTS